MSKEDNKFPVLPGMGRYKGEDRNRVLFVKWDVLSEEHAVKNHSRTLQELSEIGGLGPHEITANVCGLSLSYLEACPHDIVRETMERVALIRKSCKSMQISHLSCY